MLEIVTAERYYAGNSKPKYTMQEIVKLCTKWHKEKEIEQKYTMQEIVTAEIHYAGNFKAMQEIAQKERNVLCWK